MQIFCKETQAHLDMNPHLKDKGSANDGELMKHFSLMSQGNVKLLFISGGLITPELWLKNCKSRSTSPSSDRSKSVSPVTKAPTSSAPTHRPLITVTPSAKLLSRPSNVASHVRISPKLCRKRRSLRLCALTNIPDSLEVTNNNNASNGSKPIAATSSHETISSLHQKSPHKEPQVALKQNSAHHFLPPPPNLFPIRHSGMPGTSRFGAHTQSHAQQPPPTTQLPQNATPNSVHLPSVDQPRLFGANPPPVTILVPYPIVLPVPIPIPIPMPIIEFLKAAQAKLNEQNKDANDRNGGSNSRTANNDEPLDFTKSKDESMPILTQQLRLNKTNEPSEPTSVEKDEHQITISGFEKLDDIDGQEQRLPKFKITRLASKRIISTKESESSRPLRKRKRVIDCDYSRLRDDDKKNNF